MTPPDGAGIPDCTCAVQPESGRPHEDDCPITPLRNAALMRAAEIVANARIRAKQSE